MKIAILGTVGVPGRYGGFETLVDNLVIHHDRMDSADTITVWCSGKDSVERPESYRDANLRYVNLRANGVYSILYDAISLWQAVRSEHESILLLGVSGALALPIIRLISRAKIATNIDGIEWKREKWNGIARAVLRASEWAAVRFSHEVIADNQAIADHVKETYDSPCHVIAYGGDHALTSVADPVSLPEGLPDRYALALCRIEPENNVHMILEAFSEIRYALVFVGNWTHSAYGRNLKSQYAEHPNLHLLDPVYEPGALRALRDRVTFYVHGHSAGGTNPSLVEMMHFGVPVLAYDCVFNRYSSEDRALYFKTAKDLVSLVCATGPEDSIAIGLVMQEIAQRRYTWDQIGKAYFNLLG
ncbi:glycosyltransferase family 1 protein [Prosthecochloris vibrioformis]|uniref:Glycosyltransferase family 1 protein n=2 Tax=Prosthecochloris vibrioformis TaxID=1098 RepID=A0A5C4RSA1_PROVB|nr:glycosyltransferase family 1 protein [Prosthecochloris vibrioformis]